MDKKNQPVIIGGKKLNNLADKLLFVRDTLLRNGFPLAVIDNSITQVMLESAWLTSNIAAKDTNLSGNKLATAKSNVDFQKSLGVKQGSKAGYNEGNYHANYPNIDAWAKDYKRILSMGAAPIKAVNPADFVERLYKNNYFTSAGYSAYKTGFVATLNGLRQALDQLLKIIPAGDIKKPGFLPIIIISLLFLGIVKRK